MRVKQAEKRHFAAPSLACALLKATPAGLLGDLETLGFLFEALCERDLRIYAASFGAHLYHCCGHDTVKICRFQEKSPAYGTLNMVRLSQARGN